MRNPDDPYIYLDRNNHHHKTKEMKNENSISESEMEAIDKFHEFINELFGFPNEVKDLSL